MASMGDRLIDWVESDTFFDENGVEYIIYHKYSVTGNKTDTKVEVKSGRAHVWSGKAVKDSAAISKAGAKLGLKTFNAKDYQTYKSDLDAEVKAEEKSDEYKQELKDVLASSKSELQEASAAKQAEAIRIAGRGGAEGLNTVRDALLATGRDPAEVKEIVAGGAESVTRSLRDVLNQGQLATKDILAKMNTQELGAITSAEDFNAKYKSLADSLNLNRSKLSQAWDIANLNASTQISIAEMQQPSTLEQISGAVSAGGSAAAGVATLAEAGGLAATVLCWVAEELYGAKDTRTYLARKYCQKNNSFFISAYRKHGQTWAKTIKRFPLLRKIVKPIWDNMWQKQLKADAELLTGV